MAKLKIEYVSPEELVLNPKNPKVHPTSQVLAIKNSLDEFDWTGPILAQHKTKVVIAGHGTLKAAMLRGDRKVPVIFHNWNDKKAYKGWRVVKKTQIAHSSGITLENPMAFRTRRTELLLMNY